MIEAEPMVSFSDSDPLEFEEYVDFLKRCDLGSQYPKKDFESRIRTLLANLDVCITARDGSARLIGICFGITDFAYFLFITDLGVERSYVRKGVGKRLLALAHQKAGGEADITVTTISNEKAVGFYENCGMKSGRELFVKYCEDWEDFIVE